MIEVSCVYHHYGLKPTLSEVSFEVQTGQTLAIIGPNGSGKTTLLSILSGILSPVEGWVKIDGRERRSSTETGLAIREHTVYLPATQWFPKNVTGRQFLLGVAEIYGVQARRRFDHVERLLSVFHLGELGDADISSYSTGQKQKLNLASALITDATVLLLDEPFSGGLDPAGITAMKQILRHLTERTDRTVVMSTPVPELVEEVADEILILSEGRILIHDSIDNVKKSCNAASLDDALRELVFPETQSELRDYFASESA